MTDPLLTQALASRDIPCSHCGHNLRDCTSARCPECGCPLRLAVEADRLMRRAWLPAAALTFVAASCSVAAAVYAWQIYNTATTMVLFAGAPASTSLPGFGFIPTQMWITTSVLIGVSTASAICSLLAWRAVSRHDRTGIARAAWRCIAIAVTFAALFLIDAVTSFLQL